MPVYFLWMPVYLQLQHFVNILPYCLTFGFLQSLWILDYRYKVSFFRLSFFLNCASQTLFKIPEAYLSYTMSLWEVNKCQRNVRLFMYLLGLQCISEEALWHLVIAFLEDITQSNSAVNISKEFQHQLQDSKSGLHLRHQSVEEVTFLSGISLAKWLSQLCTFYFKCT